MDFSTEIERLRDKLHQAIDSNKDYETIIKISQQLDKYIVLHMEAVKRPDVNTAN